MLARLPAWKKMGYPGKMGINVQRGGGLPNDGYFARKI